MTQRRTIGSQPPHQGGNPIGHVEAVRTRTNRIPFVRSTGTQSDLVRIQNRAPALITPRPRPPGNPTADIL